MTKATVHDAPTVRMSERYWGLTFSPAEHGGLVATPVAFEECVPFMTKHYADLFRTEPDRFFEEKMTPAKRRYLDESDTFLFRKNGVDVGMCVCNPSDWSSYYIRTYALLPEVRGGEFSYSFLSELFLTLRAVGVSRVEADTSPTNLPVQRALTTLGMMVTSTVNTERWGLMLRLTGFLEPDADRAFRRQFLQVPGDPAGCPNPDVTNRTKKGVRP